MEIGKDRISLSQYVKRTHLPCKLSLPPHLFSGLADSYAHVERLAAGEEAIYGLNTGLGGNLGYRLKPEEIPEFQMQIIRGRATATGDPVPEPVGRGILLYRILSASKGLSGISPELFRHLCNVYEAGISPAIPEYGSIGDSDLVQTAYFALGILGEHECWVEGKLTDGQEALQTFGLTIPALKPKEGLALISHSGFTVTTSALLLEQARLAIEMAKAAIVMSYEGYGANQTILRDDLNRLRSAPLQAETAEWFRKTLEGSEHNPRRIQEALSFRTIASVIGTASHALLSAISIWEDEANGISDSPVVLPDGSMQSTINFNTATLAHSLEYLTLSLASVANSSVQRMQRITDPELSGLPKYLSPVGGGSAGVIPTQKTASSLLAEIRHAAHPVMFDPAPISSGVEDMAPNTAAVLRKLDRQLKPFKLLIGMEALVACQAIDLRKPTKLSPFTDNIHRRMRENIPMLNEDRPLGKNIHETSEILSQVMNKSAD